MVSVYDYEKWKSSGQWKSSGLNSWISNDPAAIAPDRTLQWVFLFGTCAIAASILYLSFRYRFQIWQATKRLIVTILVVVTGMARLLRSEARDICDQVKRSSDAHH